ncbi:MAG: hypothetical protein JKY94_09920 [Rhodobacteraceae bacterium]|nr:hypothetical protein [Paracoccaceae bacterium]
MVASSGIFRPSFNAGEFGELLDPRTDISEYYSACRRMRNAEPIPQSGFRIMPGSLEAGKIRNQMVELASNRTVESGPFSSFPALIETSTFDETKINAVFVGDIKPVAAVTGTFYVEALVGASWQAVGSVFTLTGDDDNRVAMLPPGQGLLASAVRIMITATGATDITNGACKVYQESGTVADNVKLHDYSFSATQTFALAFTPGWVDVSLAGVHKGGFQTAFDADQIDTLSIYDEGNTIGMFHRKIKSWRAFRVGGNNHEWRVDDWPYKDVGKTIAYGSNYDGSPYAKIDDRWEVSMNWTTDATDLALNLIVNSEETGSSSLGADPDVATTGQFNTLAAALEVALLALPSLAAGVTFVYDGKSGRSAKFTLVFGGDFSGNQYEVAAQVTNTASGAALTSHLQIGKTEGEPFISDDRGWPGVVELAQDRLNYAGLDSQPAGMILSETGEYFNLNTDQRTDDSPFARALRADLSENIVQVVYSKYLVIFTDLAEFFANDREINRNKPLNFIKASENGCSATYKPRDVSGQLYYSNASGNVLYVSTYDDVQTSYLSDPISTFAPHLFKKAKQSALRRPDDDISAHRLLTCRSDGRLIQTMILRGQNINAFSEWEDEGEILSVCVDRAGLVYLAIKRQYTGGEAINLEVWDKDQWLHGAVDYGATDLAGDLTVSSSLEGKEMWVVADGYSLGKFLVTNGVIALEDAYQQCFVGWWSPPIVEPMPLIKILPNDEILRRPGRVHTFRGKLKNTTSFAIGANGEDPVDVPLYRAGDAVDEPMKGFTGIRDVSGLSGMIEDTTIVFTQLRPGSLELRDAVMEAKL